MSMRFSVPQFLDVEDKIIGPISVRQFLTILVGGGMIFVAFKLLSFMIFIPVSLFLFVAVGMFAFGRVNGQSFHLFVLVLIQTFRNPRTKAWAKGYIPEPKTKAKQEEEQVFRKKAALTTSRLTKLGLTVDTGGVYHEEDDEVEVSLRKTDN